MSDPLDPPSDRSTAPPELNEEEVADALWRPETPEMWQGADHQGGEVSSSPVDEDWSWEKGADQDATKENRSSVGTEPDEGRVTGAPPSADPGFAGGSARHGDVRERSRSGYRRPSSGGHGGGPRSGSERRRRSRRRSSRRRRRRRILLILLGVGTFVLALGAVVGDAYLQTYRTYQNLQALQPEIAAARASLTKGQIPPGDPFQRASDVAATLTSEVDHARFTFKLTGALPFVNKPIQAARMAVTAADEDAQAAVIVRDIVKDLLGEQVLTGTKGDHGAALFQNGVVDVGLLQSLTPRLEQVIQHLTTADQSIRAIPKIPFVKSIEVLRQKAVQDSARVTTLAKRTLSSVKLIPSFLAAGGHRTYYLAFQQNAALRGTGGSVLAFGLLDIDNGALKLSRFGGILDLDNPLHGIRVKLPPQVQWYVTNARVNPRIANGSNYSPNFPVVARAWQAQAAAATGQHIDGVIALDPFAVQEVMRLVGPIKVDAYADPITAKNVVQVVEHDQFTLPAIQQVALPAQLIHRMFTRLTTQPIDMLAMLRGMSDSLSHKRLQIWTDRPDEQGLLAGLGWDGHLRSGPGDFLDMAQNNRIGNKLDYFMSQSIDYTVTVKPDGSVDSQYHVTLDNNVPTPVEGGPGLVGPPRFRGLNRGMMNLYVPKDARFRSVDPQEVQGPGAAKVSPPGFVQHIEDSFRVFTQTIIAGPNDPAQLTFLYSIPSVVQQTPEGKVYQLTLQHQPLVNPADFNLRVVLPEGANPVAPPGWVVSGNVATFHTVLDRDLVLRLVF